MIVLPEYYFEGWKAAANGEPDISPYSTGTEEEYGWAAGYGAWVDVQDKLADITQEVLW